MLSAGRQAACWQQPVDGWHTSLDQQAAVGVQAYALAAAAGDQRTALYKMIDDNACNQVAEWGLVRDEGSRGPVGTALTAAIRWLDGYSAAKFVPLVREHSSWSAWPKHPTSFAPNLQVYQVAFDEPGKQRVSFAMQRRRRAAACPDRTLQRGCARRGPRPFGVPSVSRGRRVVGCATARDGVVPPERNPARP